MRPGAGRKAKAPDEKQRNRLMVSLTDKEWEALVKAAGDEPLGGYVRRLVLRSLGRRKH